MDLFFFFHHTPTTSIYTLSLHDALPIYLDRPSRRPADRRDDALRARHRRPPRQPRLSLGRDGRRRLDRKSTRLNSSHTVISYAVFCLKKKNVHHRISHLGMAVHPFARSA